jgi:mono/diheme cytochrome c family protein
VPTGFSREQILHGDRVFHGEAANGQCSVCHGKDGKGTPNGNDLTAGMFVWSDGSVKELNGRSCTTWRWPLEWMAT